MPDVPGRGTKKKKNSYGHISIYVEVYGDINSKLIRN